MVKNKYTTMIFEVSKKKQVNKAKADYMAKNKIFKLSDADFVLSLIKDYNVSNGTR